MSVPDPLTTGVVVASVLQVAKQGQDFIAAIAGRNGESIGTILGDITRRRIENVEAVGNKAHLTLLNIGMTPAPVPLNILQPLLEGASLQEESELQDIWANLLANAATPLRTCPILPSFAPILKELTSADVKFLDALVKQAEEYSRHASPCPPLTSMNFGHMQLQEAFDASGLGRPAEELLADTPQAVQWRDDEAWTIGVVMDTLQRNGLITRNYYSHEQMTSEAASIVTSSGVSLTDLAVRFVMACRKPKGRELPASPLTS
jgi:hypothetical protein